MATQNQTELTCFTKILKYIKNRNQVGPGKIEFPDCDFLIIGPRRTLRILKPAQQNSEFYDIINDNRPESINENFITRWTKKPHSLHHCRCSFRRQSSRLSTEDRIITAEINRIRTSLCEAEKTNQNIEEIERKISINFNCHNGPIILDKIDINERQLITDNNENNDSIIKNKIVKDLENYIDELLKEVLNDTMKFISDADDTLRRSNEALGNNNAPGCRKNTQKNVTDQTSNNSLNISFAFPKNRLDHTNMENIIDLSLADGSFVNEGFIGSAHDPDCLDFDLRKPINANLDQLDCVDSGINSVETMEFQPDSGLSLEQSLMRIIDAKFGRGPLSENWDDLQHSDYDNVDNNINNRQDETIENDDLALIIDDNEIINEYKGINKIADDLSINDNKFDQLTLKLTDNPETSSLTKPVKKLNPVVVLCEKFSSKIGNNCKNNEINKEKNKYIVEKQKKSSYDGAEMRDYRTTWKRGEESSPIDEESPRDLVVFRRNRKPIIVFIHGFGSSAEVFEHQLRYFSQMGYPCIAPDMLGHGISSAPGKSRDYRFDKLLNDLEAILHHYAFKPGQKCVLVAHNYGCSFATALACKYENEINQLVLISGGGPTPLAPPSREGPGHCCMRAMLSPLLMCGLHRDILYSARGRQHPYCGIEPEEQWPSHMKYILDGMIWPEGDYIFHRRICTPTLLIHGLRDNKVSLVQECQMERTIVKAFLEAIPTAGHIPMTETPEQVNHMIHCFIDLWKKKEFH